MSSAATVRLAGVFLIGFGEQWRLRSRQYHNSCKTWDAFIVGFASYHQTYPLIFIDIFSSVMSVTIRYFNLNKIMFIIILFCVAVLYSMYGVINISQFISILISSNIYVFALYSDCITPYAVLICSFCDHSFLSFSSVFLLFSFSCCTISCCRKVSL